MKKLLLLPLLAFNLVQCVEIKEIFAPKSLGKVALYHNKNKFWVHHKGGYHKVRNCFIDKNLRNIDEKTLRAFVASNYISINKGSDNEFSLNAKVRGLGGGPIFGAIGYWGTKALCYGTAAAAVGTITVANGGLAGGAVGVATTAATMGASTGASLVAGGIAGAGLAGEAALATVGAVSATGSIAATVAAIESGAFAVGSTLLCCPFLP